MTTTYKIYDLSQIGAIGYIPDMIDPTSEVRFQDQLNITYAHGGGWRPFKGFKFAPSTLEIKYPGDPAHLPIASIKGLTQTLVIYPYGWVGIIDDATPELIEISRMD
jgi:hypothetical protein